MAGRLTRTFITVQTILVNLTCKVHVHEEADSAGCNSRSHIPCISLSVESTDIDHCPFRHLWLPWLFTLNNKSKLACADEAGNCIHQVSPVCQRIPEVVSGLHGVVSCSALENDWFHEAPIPATNQDQPLSCSMELDFYE